MEADGTEQDSTLTKLGVSAGLFGCAYAMYSCLVTYTGAVPAEFFSAKKRKGYIDYQKTVPMFFPSFLGGKA